MISSNLIFFGTLIISSLPYHIVFLLSPPSSSASHDHTNYLTAKRCNERCALHRKRWHTEPYSLNCSLYPDSSDCIMDCVLACHSPTCGKHNVAAKTSTVFVCPTAPKLDHKCLERCDETRPKGKTVQYVLNCSKEYATSEEMISCSNDCDKCPNWVCNKQEDPNMFYCPHTVLEGECKERCDSKRSPKGTAFQLNCVKMSTNDKERKSCEDYCVHCPAYVCSRKLTQLYNSTIYNCPAGISGESQSETSWFVFSLVAGILGLIFFVVMIWICVYYSRHGGVCNREQGRQEYGLQLQIIQDPYNFIESTNGEQLVTLQPSNTTTNSSEANVSGIDDSNDEKSIDWDNTSIHKKSYFK